MFTPLLESRPLWSGAPAQLAPRIAAAWRLTPSGDTMLRASWSVFQDNQSAASSDQLNGIPYQQLRTPTGAPGDIYDASQLVHMPLGYGYSRNLRLPTYRRWSVHLEHDWHHRDSLALSYSGLSGAGELRREIALNSSAVPGGLIFASSQGSSQYHGLSVLYRRSLVNGFQANIGYTWSHSIDVSSSDSSVFLIFPTRGAATDRGDSDFDVRDVLNVALTYSSPQRGHSLAGRFFYSWNFGAMVFARSGFPLDVLVSETLDGFAIANYRPTLFPNVSPWIADPAAPGGRVLNPNAFGYPFSGVSPWGGTRFEDSGCGSSISRRSVLCGSATGANSLFAPTPTTSRTARVSPTPALRQQSDVRPVALGPESDARRWNPQQRPIPGFLMGAPF